MYVDPYLVARGKSNDVTYTQPFQLITANQEALVLNEVCVSPWPLLLRYLVVLYGAGNCMHGSLFCVLPLVASCPTAHTWSQCMPPRAAEGHDGVTLGLSSYCPVSILIWRMPSLPVSSSLPVTTPRRSFVMIFAAVAPAPAIH